jgi:hypothetical protein
MERIEIAVPDINDSFSRVTLSGKQYLIRFSYNDTGGYWTFGLYSIQKEPIAQGIKIVPNFPLNLSCASDEMPPGIFGVYTDLQRVGRNDFLNGKAIFAYIPAE